MRGRLLGGLIGPAVFITAWAVLGWRADDYSAVEDPISRLAAAGAPTQPAMTTALLVFAVGLAIYGSVIGRFLGPWVERVAWLNAAATVGVALTPLDSSVGGAPHAIAAGVGYATIAALPLLGGRVLWRVGSTALGAVSIVVGLAAAGALTTSLVVDGNSGLWQRVGLTIADLWVMGSAASLGLGARPRLPAQITPQP